MIVPDMELYCQRAMVSHILCKYIIHAYVHYTLKSLSFLFRDFERHILFCRQCTYIVFLLQCYVNKKLLNLLTKIQGRWTISLNFLL